MANIAKNAPEIMPTVGDYATYHIGSDRYPFEVVKVSKSGKMVYLRPLKAIRTDSNGQFEIQTYTYEPTEGDWTMKATLRKDGSYKAVGNTTYGTVTLGYANAYSDPSF